MITWDFDIIKGDVIFTVFRHKRPKEACSGSLTNLGDGPSCGVVANVDAVVVERPKTCHDGDSVQVGGVLSDIRMVLSGVINICHKGNGRWGD